MSQTPTQRDPLAEAVDQLEADLERQQPTKVVKGDGPDGTYCPTYHREAPEGSMQAACGAQVNHPASMPQKIAREKGWSPCQNPACFGGDEDGDAR